MAKLQKILALLFGLFLCFLLLEITARAGYFLFNHFLEKANQTPAGHEYTHRIVCLGDSMTALGGTDSWPRQLETVLNKRQPGKTFKIINKGRVEGDTAFIMSHLEEYMDAYSPDIIAVMAGINEEGVLFYEGIDERESFLFKHCKAYKVLRIMWQQLTGSAERFSSPDEMYTNPATRRNFQAMAGIIGTRGGRLVVVQYPLRRLAPLEELFEGKNDIIFVDTEQVFREALNESSYEIYFKDRFGGDFGHCTRKGNRLLAETIGGAILSGEAAAGKETDSQP